VQIIDEEAVDFHLVDDEGSAIGIEVDGARLLVQDPKLVEIKDPERLFPLATDPAAANVVNRYHYLVGAGKRRALPGFQAAEVILGRVIWSRRSATSRARSTRRSSIGWRARHRCARRCAVARTCR
jgi:hypothetical protein